MDAEILVEHVLPFADMKTSRFFFGDVLSNSILKIFRKIRCLSAFRLAVFL